MDTLLKIAKGFGGVILGWVLGFASALLNDWVKGHRKRKAIQRAVSTELLEVAYRLLFVVYLTLESGAFGSWVTRPQSEFVRV